MLAFLCFITSCQQPAILTESQRAVIRDSVIQLNNRYFDDVKANRLGAVLDYIDDSPEFFWVFPPDTTVISHDALVAMFKTEVRLYRSIDLVWDYMRVEPLTNQYAVYTGKFHETKIDISNRVTKFNGAETGIVVHRPTGWKFLNGQTFEVSQKKD